MALIEHDDVARLFRGLVTVLAERDPARLRTGFQVAELYQQLVPYRTHRGELGFDSNQDYEGAVLGLLAGLGGYASVEPEEVRDTLAAEVESPNPDPTLFREFAGARVRLDPARVRQVLDANASYAPPPPEPEPASPPPPPTPRGPVFELAGAPVFELAQEAPAEPPPSPGPTPLPTVPCPHCGTGLPDDRPVIFCPFCGKAVGAPTCSHCGDELRSGWKFCPRCGHAQPV